MHLAKYNRAAIGHMLRHYDRSGVAHRDQGNIDGGLTSRNYNLGPQRGMSQKEFLDNRLQEVKISKKRPDIVLMYDIVVTLPQDFQGDKKKFFDVAYKNLVTKAGGENNVISAYVHLDEPDAQPHMHFAAMPITKDNRLCCKDITTRQYLKTLHPDMQQAMDDAGLHCTIVNEETLKDRGVHNQSIADLKKSTAKELNELNNAIETLKASMDDIDALSRKNAFMGKIRLSETDYKAMLTSLQDYKRLKDDYEALKQSNMAKDAIVSAKDKLINDYNRICDALRCNPQLAKLLQKAMYDHEHPNQVATPVRNLGLESLDARFGRDNDGR